MLEQGHLRLCIDDVFVIEKPIAHARAHVPRKAAVEVGREVLGGAKKADQLLLPI